MSTLMNMIPTWMNVLLEAVAEKRFSPLKCARTMYIMSSILYHTRKFYTGADRQPSYDNFPLPAKGRIFSPVTARQRNFIYIYAIQVSVEIGNGILFQNSEILQRFLETHPLFLNAEYKRFLVRSKLFVNEMKLKISTYILQRSEDGSGGDFNTASLPNAGVRILKDQIQDLGSFPRPLEYTLVEGQNWLGPGWGNVRGVGLTDVGVHEDAVRRFVEEADLEKEARKVYETSLGLRDREKAIAEFWAGGPGTITPPGLWNLFLAIYFEKNHATLSLSFEKMCRDWFLLASGLFQASISVWKLKYQYFQARPIQVIRYLLANEFITSYYGGENVPASAWKPYQPGWFMTPPFPDFISGHSTFSACGARILSKITGTDLPSLRLSWKASHLALVSPLFENPQNVPSGAQLHCLMILPRCSEIQAQYPESAVPLTYYTWDDMALEAGLSRIYGGIHYDSSNYAGYLLGTRLAESVCDLYRIYQG